MPNSPNPARVQLTPGGDFNQRVIPVTRQPKRTWIRVATDFSIPQAWGLAVKEHPAAFEAIKYSSRFLDQPCLAIFDRGGLQAKLKEKALGALSKLDAAVDWLDERRAALV